MPSDYDGKEKRKNKIFRDIGDIRHFFTPGPCSDVQIQHLNKDKAQKCILLKTNDQGKLLSMLCFDSLAKLLNNMNISVESESVDAISSTFPNYHEMIYQLNSQEFKLISRDFPSGEIVFLQSSFENIKELQNEDEIILIPKMRKDFQFLQECLVFQALLQEKSEKEQHEENNVAV
jgi:hypothetical protein